MAVSPHDATLISGNINTTSADATPAECLKCAGNTSSSLAQDSGHASPSGRREALHNSRIYDHREQIQ
jgi:hypothetical protein